MSQSHIARGQNELRDVRRKSRHLFWAVGLFSFFVNALMLTGPLYMLNIYDRVLSSRSVETLFALSVLVVFLFTMMGVLDYARGRIMARVGARFQATLDERVFDAMLKAKTSLRAPAEAATGLRDLEAIQRLMVSPAAMALFDLPWTPLFFFGIFIFHPLMGAVAIAGTAALLLIALMNKALSHKPISAANATRIASEEAGARVFRESELVQSLGMHKSAFHRWQIARKKSLHIYVETADLAGSFIALSKSFRMLLQSIMLGLGAYLVLMNQLTVGAMFAGSILLGRALAPIDLVVTQWAIFQRGREGWQNLALLLGEFPLEMPRTVLPFPKASLRVEKVTVFPPGGTRAALNLVSFDVSPGQAVGVIGPSGAGKTSLARVLTGAWQPAAGALRLDGAALNQYHPDVLGQYVGYLPQRVQLFEGTIKENIARMMVDPDDAVIIKAAKAAAVHTMITSLPNGYDTPVTDTGGGLSGGQIQQIGLARALFGDPVIVVLDEPNANLDCISLRALNATISDLKRAGKVVLIMAHQPSAIQECDLLLMLENGQRRAFGPKEEVLARVARNDEVIQGGQSRLVGVS